METNKDYALSNQDYTLSNQDGALGGQDGGLGGQDGGLYDSVGNSAHYQSNFMEYIREQERKYGTIIAYFSCLTQVDRYNQRAGTKQNVPAEKDLIKRDWYKTISLYYLEKIQTLRQKNNSDERIVGRKLDLIRSYVGMAEEVFDLLSPELMFKNILLSDQATHIPLSEIQLRYKKC